MSYPRINPGDPFRPLAEKENALSRLLESVENPAAIPTGIYPEERSVSMAFNVSEDIIQAGQPVRIFSYQDSVPEGAPEFNLETPALLVAQVAEKQPQKWGVALEAIGPKGIGPVQMHGVCVFPKVAGNPAERIDIAADGSFVFSGYGIARVLRVEKTESGYSALVFLGSAYNGPFAVRFDGKTVSVINGEDPESAFAGYYYMNGEFREAKSKAGITPAAGYLCLKDWNISSENDYEIKLTVPSKPIKDGDPDYHPIARITRNGDTWSFRQVSKWEIPQLWTFEDCSQ